MKIGTANYEKGSKTSIEKIKDGDNIYRILPPLGSYADKGRWNRYLKIEWGYKDSKGNNRPFQDVREVNRKTKMVEVESAAHLKREELAAQLAQVVEMYKAGQVSKEQLEKMKKLTEQYNLEKRYFLNAINTKGEIVLLKIGYKAMQGLELQIKTLRDKGVDPLSVDNGRFFNIRRDGSGLDTVYSVSVHKETINHPDLGLVEKEIVHKLDDAIIGRLAREAKDLGELDKLYPVVTPEQVELIVSGPAGVDQALGVREDNNTTEDDGGDDEVSSPAVKAATQATTPSTVTSTVTTNISSATTKVEESKAPINTPAPAASANGEKEAFLKSLGL